MSHIVLEAVQSVGRPEFPALHRRPIAWHRLRLSAPHKSSKNTSQQHFRLRILTQRSCRAAIAGDITSYVHVSSITPRDLQKILTGP